MQGFKVKTDSWHYKWISWYRFVRDIHEPKGYYSALNKVFNGDLAVTKYHSNEYKRITNFCQYWRVVLLWPLLRFAFNLSSIFAVIAAIAYFGIGGFFIGGIGIAVIVAAGVILSGLFFVVAVIMKKTGDMVTAVEKTEFVGTIISTYKDNFCPLVTYEDTEK